MALLSKFDYQALSGYTLGSIFMTVFNRLENTRSFYSGHFVSVSLQGAFRKEGKLSCRLKYAVSSKI